MNLHELTSEVLNGKQITREEALFLYDQPLNELCESADQIRRHFCADRFDICTIVNAKSGNCSENYKFCAQSARNHIGAATYPLPDKGKSCFTSGANAAISGDMLTTAGITTKTDMALLKKLGYEVKICNE